MFSFDVSYLLTFEIQLNMVQEQYNSLIKKIFYIEKQESSQKERVERT